MHSRMKIRLFCCNTQTVLVPQGKHRGEIKLVWCQDGILLSYQSATSKKLIYIV